MSRWWRAYDDALHDPKVQRLPPHLFKTWFNLLCIASKYDGNLPAAETLAFLLRRRVDDVRRDVAALCARCLFDVSGDVITPHNWNTRQYKSDLSTQRVRTHRKRSSNVSETPARNVSETPPDTDTDTDTERKKDSWSVAAATRPTIDEKFDQFWSWYPKRDGANPKAPARKLFLQYIRSGVDPDDITAGARRCREKERDKIGTPYIPQAVKWLRDRRWEDYSAELALGDTGPPKPPDPTLPSDEELRRKYAGTPNERAEAEGYGILEESAGLLREDTVGTKGKSSIPDYQAGQSGMASMGKILPRPELRAMGDDRDQAWRDRDDDGTSPMARMV
jgi:hypothetical protein